MQFALWGDLHQISDAIDAAVGPVGRFEQAVKIVLNRNGRRGGGALRDRVHMADTKADVRVLCAKRFEQRIMIGANQVVETAHKDKDDLWTDRERVKQLPDSGRYQIIVAVDDIALIDVKIREPALELLLHRTDCTMSAAGKGADKKFDAFRHHHADSDDPAAAVRGRGVVQGVFKAAAHDSVTSSTLSASR